MKWVVTFVVCIVLNESVGAPQGHNLRDDGEIFDDFLQDFTSEGAKKRVRREDGRSVMDILTGNVPRGPDDVVRVIRSVDDPMLISPGPQPCDDRSRDAGPFDGPHQQQYFDPGSGPHLEPKTHKLPALPIGGLIGGGGLGGHVGLIGHHESLLEPVHKETIYYATIPFISGYKMTPIISNKKIIVKDLPGHGHDGLIGGGHVGIGAGLGGIGGGGLLHDGLSPGLPGLPGLAGLPGLPGLPPFGGLPSGFSLGGPTPSPSSRSSRPDMSYMTQADYETEGYPCPADLDDSFAQSRSSHPQDFYIPDPNARHPLDLNIFFETPEAASAARDAAPELLTPETYADAIRNLQQQMDHLHSLKLAQERRIQPDQVNFV